MEEQKAGRAARIIEALNLGAGGRVAKSFCPDTGLLASVPSLPKDEAWLSGDNGKSGLIFSGVWQWWEWSGRTLSIRFWRSSCRRLRLIGS
jgi:hypothetical protein